MPQILASGKVGSNKYDNRATNPNKVLPRLDMRQIAQSFQRLYEVVKGFSLSGNEGFADALDDDMSIITASNINTYKNDISQAIQTMVSAACILEVDTDSTENALILNAKKISADLAPDGNDYSIEAPLPFSWQEDLTFKFRAIATNTDGVTISIPDLSGLSGSIEVLDENQNALPRESILANKYYTVVAKTVSSVKKFLLIPTPDGKNVYRKNAIINGALNIWQRGGSFAAIADAAYFADRWMYNKSSAAVHTASKSTDVPTVSQAGLLFNYSALIDCTTVDASISSGDYVAIQQRIEGYNFRPLAQKTITVSFWVKATKTGIYCCSLQNSASDRSYVAEYTINAADTWEKKTITFQPSPSTGTWNYTSGIGLKLIFTLACGSTYQATANSWQSGNYFATSNQVNACDNTANNFRLTGVQLEEGAIASSFENIKIQEELSECQRYFEKSYDTNSLLGAVEDNGKSSIKCAADGGININTNFKTKKRSPSTVIIYSPATGDSGKVRNESSSTDADVSPSSNGETGFGINKGGFSSSQIISWHWSADSEL